MLVLTYVADCLSSQTCCKRLYLHKTGCIGMSSQGITVYTPSRELVNAAVDLLERYADVMASPAAPLPSTGPPSADPEAIRACLSAGLLAEFDREWELVLERAKQDKTMTGVHSMLGKWRHLAIAEMRDPGSYDRLLAKTEQITRTGSNPDASSGEVMRALIDRRIGRQA